MMRCADRARGPDILVNNAGIQHVAPVEDFPPGKWDSIIAINLSAAFHTTRLAVPAMKAKGWGRILNTGSAHSLVASPNKSAYVAAKHGIAGFTKSGRAGDRAGRHHGQLHFPGLCLDAAGRAANSRYHEDPRADPRAGRERRASCGSADEAVRHARRRLRRWRCSCAARRPGRSPARTSASTAGGPLPDRHCEARTRRGNPVATLDGFATLGLTMRFFPLFCFPAPRLRNDHAARRHDCAVDHGVAGCRDAGRPGTPSQLAHEFRRCPRRCQEVGSCRRDREGRRFARSRRRARRPPAA